MVIARPWEKFGVKNYISSGILGKVMIRLRIPAFKFSKSHICMNEYNFKMD